MYFILYARIPFLLHIIGGPILAYIAIVFNLFIFICLCNKSIRTPTTVIMQGLAISDALTAFCTYGFEPLFAPLFHNLGITDVESVIEIGSSSGNVTFQLNTPKKLHLNTIEALVFLDYPLCVIHYCASNFSDAFHLVSVLLTTALGLQKFLAVAFPIYYRMSVNKAIRNSIIICCMSFVFPVVLTFPRLFVVSFSSTKTNACFLSEPNQILEKYVLKHYSFLFSFILALAVMLMSLSTCYILSVLLFRRSIKERKNVPKHETRSCVLIVCVLIVFVLSEIPRLYLYGRVFTAYKDDIDEDNIAWKKAKAEIDSRSKCCLRTKQKQFMTKIQSDLGMTLNVDCKTKNETLGLSNSYESWINTVVYDIAASHYNDYTEKLISNINYEHRKMVEVIMNKVSSRMLNNLQTSLTNSLNMLECNELGTAVMNQIIHSYEHAFNACDISRVPTVHNKMANLILGSSPYSEPLNYILNIVWGENDITLNELKIYVEVYKFCSVFACSSNFIIYIVMSKVLRETFWRKFKTRTKNGNSMRKSVTSSRCVSETSSWTLRRKFSSFKISGNARSSWTPSRQMSRDKGTITTSFQMLIDNNTTE